MYPRVFEYFAPRNLRRAISLLTTYGEDAKILAGGHSLVPLMKLRLASPKYLVDINRIPGLSYIKEEDGEIQIGALTRDSEIEYSSLLQAKCPILPETAKFIGDPQVRNRGTLGGNIAHADPANDFPPTMLALKAEFVATGPRGKRTIKAENFFTDMFTIALRSNEVLTEIRIPASPPRSGGCFMKFERKVGDFAIVAVAAQLTLDKQGVCKDVGIGLGAVGPTPIKARKAEEVLRGKRVTAELIQEAAAKCSEVSRPYADIRGSTEYKKEMVKVFGRRALQKAFERAQGGGS